MYQSENDAMKKSILVILASFLISSCEKTEDDSNLVCTQDCSEITGKVYTHSGIPLKNILMKFKFSKNGSNNVRQTRIISKVKTNSLGEYAMNFYLNDEELGEWIGDFSLYADKNTVPGNLFYQDYFNLFDTMYTITNRDFSVTRNLYIPTPKKVKIRLNNFNGPEQEDYFRVLAEVPCGFDYDDSINPETGNNHKYATLGLNKYMLTNYNNLTSKTFEVDLALNERNYILVGKMKNGVYTQERISIDVTENSNQILEFNY